MIERKTDFDVSGEFFLKIERAPNGEYQTEVTEVAVWINGIHFDITQGFTKEELKRFAERESERLNWDDVMLELEAERQAERDDRAYDYYRDWQWEMGE